MPSVEILEASVVKLCQLNELTTLFSPWIIFVPSTSQLARKIHPAAFALIYAIAEQSLTFACHYLAWHPLIAISHGPVLELIAGFMLSPLEKQRSVSLADKDITSQNSIPSRVYLIYIKITTITLGRNFSGLLNAPQSGPRI